MRRSAGLTLTTAALFTTAPTLAQPPKDDAVRLTYARAPGAEACPDEAAFRHIVAARMGGTDPFHPQGSRRLTVTITRNGPSFQGEIALYDAADQEIGRRSFADSPTCTPLLDEIATTLHLRYLAPITLSRLPPLAPYPRPSTPPPPSSIAPSPPPLTTNPPPHAKRSSPKPPAATSRSPREEIGLGVLMPIGTTPPGITGGISASFGIRWPALSLTIDARADLPRTADADIPGTTITTTFFGSSLALCGHYSHFLGCGLFTVGALHGAATGAFPISEFQPRIEAGARLGVEQRLSPRWMLRFTADAQGVLIGSAIFVNESLLWNGPRFAVVPAVRVVTLF